MKKDILICGVGGQGTVLASKIIAAAAMEAGNNVHSAETIGMAQRGGSVTSHVRIGEASSPLIPKGKCDLLLAFEPSEAVRNLPYLKENGLVVFDEVCRISARAIVNKVSFKMKREEVMTFITDLKEKVNEKC